MIDWKKVHEVINESNLKTETPENTIEQRLLKVENKVAVIEQVVEIPQEIDESKGGEPND